MRLILPGHYQKNPTERRGFFGNGVFGIYSPFSKTNSAISEASNFFPTSANCASLVVKNGLD